MNLTTSENPAGVLKTDDSSAHPTDGLTTDLHSSHSLSYLPDKPLVIIEPRRSWVALDVRGLWPYRELLYFLTWRDVKIRYKQTLFGVAWAVMQPLFTMIVFTLFFGRLAGMPSDGVPYPLFAYAGLLPWTFFANAITSSSNSLVGSANLITKVYFPRMIIPTAAVAAGLVDFAIAFVILIGLMAYYGVGVTWNMLMLLPLVALTTLLALGTGMLLSALNVKYRDVRFVLPFLVQLWMFVSPVIYPMSIVPETWQWVLALNPVSGIIENLRVALFGQRDFDWLSLATSAALTFALLIYSAYTFRRMEQSFADTV
jgi:lipopolysaccharide transport system permease protein